MTVRFSEWDDDFDPHQFRYHTGPNLFVELAHRLLGDAPSNARVLAVLGWGILALVLVYALALAVV